MASRELAVHFRAGAIKSRSLDELIGLCKGVTADLHVCQAEAQFLLNWLEANKAVAREFPANVLYPRLVEMLADGVLDADESKELLVMLQQMTGEQGQQGTVTMSTGIGFDSPLPELSFPGQAFCLTGEFAYGRRADVEGRTCALGGTIAKSVVKRGCIVVVGCMGSEAWIHSTHGRNIQAAVTAREEGHPVSVVPEEHWHIWAEKHETSLADALQQQAEDRTWARNAFRRLMQEG